MALNDNQRQLITQLDLQVNKILSTGGGDEELLMLLAEVMDDDLKSILASSNNEELDEYCEEYQGFYHLMKLLEQMALFTSRRKT